MANKSVARKHHYLPQSYLAAFTTRGTKESQFCVLEIVSGRSFRTSPSNVGSQRDFNRVDIEGHSPGAIENALAPFEGDAVSAIRRVLDTQEFPCDEDWNLILNLLALIAVRNPQRRNSFNHSRDRTLRMIGEMLTSDRSLWESHVRKARESGEHIPEVPFEEVRSFIEKGNFSFVFHPEESLRVEFNALDKVLPLLGERTWSVLVAPPDAPEFICSDHPVTLECKHGRKGPVGFGLRETEVFFPLGRRIGFYGVYESLLQPVVQCKPLNVAIMNGRVANNAERHVYSALDTFSVWHNNSIQEIPCKV